MDIGLDLQRAYDDGYKKGWEEAEAYALHCGDETPITNADRIRAMTDDELAVQIALPYLTSPPWCSEHTTCPYISEDPTPCDKCALDWLKQEVSTNG